VKKLWDIRSDRSGSALLAVVMVIAVVLILGMGILTLSVSNARQNKIDDTYERDYYSADGGAQQGVEALKSAALEQYRMISTDLINNVQSSNNATSFFTALDAVTYSPPQPDSSVGGPSSLSVTITHSTVDADTHRYTISSTATDGKTPRKIVGSVDINFIPVTTVSGFTPLGTQAVVTGGTLVTNGNYSEITGDVRFGTLPSYSQYQFKLNGQINPDLSPYVDTTTAASINWNMSYPGFTSSAKPSSGQLTLPAYSSATSITNSAFSGAPYNWTVPSPIYLDLEGSSGTYTMSSFDYVGGVIYCTTNLTNSCPHITGTSSNYVKIYCKGNLTLSGVVGSYVKVYCDGNVTISGGGIDHLTVYCNGTLNDSSNSKTQVRFYCNSYIMSGGQSSGDNIIYAKSSMTIQSSPITGLYYSGGNITIQGGSSITGQIAAKGTITMNGPFNYIYDAAMLQRLNADAFPTSTGGGTVTTIQPPSSQIYSTPSYQES
jgi:hypothetical protein